MFSSHLRMRSPFSPNKTGVSTPTQARAALRTAEFTAIINKTLATCSGIPQFQDSEDEAEEY